MKHICHYIKKIINIFISKSCDHRYIRAEWGIGRDGNFKHWLECAFCKKTFSDIEYRELLLKNNPENNPDNGKGK